MTATDRLLAEGRIVITNRAAVDRGAPPVFATVHKPRELRKPRWGRTGLTPKPDNQLTTELADLGVAAVNHLRTLARTTPKPMRYESLPLGTRGRARREARRLAIEARNERRRDRSAK